MTTPVIAMEHVPLKTVDDQYALGRACAVCGESTLSVVHMENLPDYVNCMQCESAFILNETADWIMFGSISAEFPETAQTVLKRWTTLEAVQAMACSERMPEIDKDETLPKELGADSGPPLAVEGDGLGLTAAKVAATPPFGIGELDEFEAESSNGGYDPQTTRDEPSQESADISEPEPGHRYFVTLAQKAAVIPPERCAHCLRQPATRKLQFAPTAGQDLGFQVPLCESCHERACAGSEEQKTSKIVAHLTSILVAGLLIVGALAVGLINIQEIGMIDLVLIASLGLVGYGIPAALLLRRSSRLPPSEDAQFVRSTLQIRDNEGLAFGWRNRGYAERFFNANRDHLLGNLTRISDHD